MIAKIYKSWAVRHVHPANYLLHLLGIPMAVAGIVVLCLKVWVFGSLLFVGGYALQFWGHAIEGNEVGEVTLIKSIAKKIFPTKS